MLRAELNQLPPFKLDLADVDILYPHFVSHPIGIDLHESSSFDRSGKLQAGMVITIEPGGSSMFFVDGVCGGAGEGTMMTVLDEEMIILRVYGQGMINDRLIKALQ